MISQAQSLESLIITPPYKCNTEDGSNQLWVHVDGGQVPLWIHDAVVTYTIQSSSFPSAAHADFVKQQTSRYTISEKKCVGRTEKKTRMLSLFFEYFQFTFKCGNLNGSGLDSKEEESITNRYLRRSGKQVLE
jgi:hypothetical protein